MEGRRSELFRAVGAKRFPVHLRHFDVLEDPTRVTHGSCARALRSHRH